MFNKPMFQCLSFCVCLVMLGCSKAPEDPKIDDQPKPLQQKSDVPTPKATSTVQPTNTSVMLLTPEKIDAFYARLISAVNSKNAASVCDLTVSNMVFSQLDLKTQQTTSSTRDQYCQSVDAYFKALQGSDFSLRLFPQRVTYHKNGEYVDLSIYAVELGKVGNSKQTAKTHTLPLHQTIRLVPAGNDAKIFNVLVRLMSPEELSRLKQQLKTNN